MKILKITDPAFLAYGRMIEGLDLAELTAEMRKMPIPEGVVYEPSVAELERLRITAELQDRCFGELPIQVGMCIGHNRKLNAVEYHRSSEVNIAVTDAILILGQQKDITADFQYDTGQMDAFYLPAGTAVELYATTLHYAPCQTQEAGFLVTVVLPKGTNEPLEKKHGTGEDGLLTAKNKWLIGHPDGGLAEGSFLGLVGRNLEVD